MDILLDRKTYIGVFVIGYLLRGIIFHFFPLINDVLMWFSVLWPALFFIKNMKSGVPKLDHPSELLAAFCFCAIFSTAINYHEYLIAGEVSVKDVCLSLWNVFCAFFILFHSSNVEDASNIKFILNLSLVIVLIVSLLAGGSLVLYGLYSAGIRLPGGFGNADQIFTYGHLGDDMRFCGLFGYSTDGGNLCALALVLTLFLYEQNRISVPIAIAGSLIFIVTILLLDVRTSLLQVMLVALVCTYILLRKKWSRKQVLGGMILIIGISAAAIMFLKWNSIRELFRQICFSPFETMSFLTTGRSKYWLHAIQRFGESPLFGKGWLNCNKVGFFDTHNLITNLLLWTGLTGTVAISVFGVLTAKMIYAKRNEIKEKRVRMLALLVLSVLLESMLERAVLGTAMTSVDTSMFWVSLGALVYLPDTIKPE